MNTVKSIQSIKAERAAIRFARDHKLALDDPIVIQLRNGLKMTLGYLRWRNEIEAAKAKQQPSLFPTEAKPAPQTITEGKAKIAQGNASGAGADQEEGGTAK